MPFHFHHWLDAAASVPESSDSDYGPEGDESGALSISCYNRLTGISIFVLKYVHMPAIMRRNC